MGSRRSRFKGRIAAHDQISVAKNPLPPTAGPIRFGTMSARRPQIIKTGLGRGLDELMTGTKTAGHGDTGSEAPAQTIKVNVQAGQGLGTLLRGNKASERAAGTIQPGERSDAQDDLHHPVVFCSLLAADILLLGQAALLVLRAARPPGFTELLFAFICVGFGAWLACLAVLLRSPDRR